MSLEIKNITHNFIRKRSNSNVFTVLKNVSLSPEKGKITVITGPSGSGKTTLLNITGGILKPAGGQIIIEGRDLYCENDTGLSAFRNKNIGMVPQGTSAVYSLSVFDNVMLPSSLYGKKDANRPGEEKRALELLEKMGIADLKDTKPGELSGGELRRMAVARAMLKKPAVLLADEPTNDLDCENSAIVLSMMKQAACEGSTVIIVTHDISVAGQADDIYELKKGIINKMEVKGDKEQ